MNYDHSFVKMYTSHSILSMSLITNWCKNAYQYFLSHLSQWLNMDPGSFKRGKFRAGQHWGEERVEERRPQLPGGFRSTFTARRQFWVIIHKDAQLTRTTYHVYHCTRHSRQSTHRPFWKRALGQMNHSSCLRTDEISFSSTGNNWGDVLCSTHSNRVQPQGDPTRKELLPVI